MNKYSQDISSLIDNELDDKTVINEIIDDAELQQQFSRYQLMGDVMRNESHYVDLRIDVTDGVMAAIANEVQFDNVVPFTSKAKDNVTSFMKRFGQYAIAASVAGVVVISSLMVNQGSITDPNATPVLNTVPFAGSAAPVSLEVAPSETKNAIKERNQHLEALLKDHQLQLQTQP